MAWFLLFTQQTLMEDPDAPNSGPKTLMDFNSFNSHSCPGKQVRENREVEVMWKVVNAYSVTMKLNFNKVWVKQKACIPLIPYTNWDFSRTASVAISWSPCSSGSLLPDFSFPWNVSDPHLPPTSPYISSLLTKTIHILQGLHLPYSELPQHSGSY